MSEEFTFDLTLIEVPVKIDEEDYVLKEATEETARSYHNKAMDSVKMGPANSPVSAKGLADLGSYLLSNCLFKVDEDGKHAPVGILTVRKWPHRIVKPLVLKAKEISGLQKEEEEAGKKD